MAHSRLAQSSLQGHHRLGGIYLAPLQATQLVDFKRFFFHHAEHATLRYATQLTARQRQQRRLVPSRRHVSSKTERASFCGV